MKNKISLLSIFFVCFSISNLFSQGNIEIIKDPKIDALIKKQGESSASTGEPQIPGYRVQIYFDASKSKVDEMRANFNRSHSKVQVYVTYSAPNYFLRVGDFRTNQEAERFKQEIISKYPTSFVVKEKINLPRID